MANSAEFVKMPGSAVSALGDWCYLKPGCPITKSKYGKPPSHYYKIGKRKVHKPQPFPDPKRKRKPTNLNKHKPNKRMKSTKISSLFPKRGNRNTKRTEKHKNKMTHGKTYNKPPRRINHKATKSKTNTGTTKLNLIKENVPKVIVLKQTLDICKISICLFVINVRVLFHLKYICILKEGFYLDLTICLWLGPPWINYWFSFTLAYSRISHQYSSLFIIVINLIFMFSL